MEISIVLFLFIIVLGCLTVGIAVYLYIYSTYHRKKVFCELFNEKRFNIPIESEDESIELEAKLLYSRYTPNPAPCVITCHGWGGTLDDLPYIQYPLALQGYVVFAYSSRGHGKSGGKRALSDF